MHTLGHRSSEPISFKKKRVPLAFGLKNMMEDGKNYQLVVNSRRNKVCRGKFV